MTSSSLIINVSSFLTLASHVLLVLFGLALLLRLKVASSVSRAISTYAFHLAFLISILGVVGSLMFSEIIGFAPCVLCWYGRIFLYPQAIILGIAIFRRDNNIVPYILGLSIPGALLSLYQSYAQLGGYSLTPCTSTGGSCSKIYFLEYGYITIPTMAFTAFLLIIILMLVRMKESR